MSALFGKEKSEEIKAVYNNFKDSIRGKSIEQVISLVKHTLAYEKLDTFENNCMVINITMGKTENDMLESITVRLYTDTMELSDYIDVCFQSVEDEMLYEDVNVNTNL